MTMTSSQLQHEINKTWTVQDICTRYNTTVMSVHAWRARGLPCITIKGTARPAIRFLPSEAGQWIKANIKSRKK
jgi:hypothetical protein